MDMDFRFQMIDKRLKQIDKVLLIVSGKGGVGKSVIAATLANFVSNMELVGLLDLDMHGPTLPFLLNHSGRFRGKEGGVEPVMAGKVKLVSLGLVTGEKPMPLKGEVKRDLIVETLSEIDWERLNYLILDLPPGTGDEVLTAIRLTIMKSSAILVSTPSPHSLGAVKRMLGLLVDEGVDVTGLVLNMAYIADETHRVVMPFGKYNLQEIEEAMGVKVIAELPLEPEIASSTPINMAKLSSEFLKGLGNIYRAVEE